MPKDFERCVAEGGRVRTKNLGGGKYMHLCFKNGKSYAGEVKIKEKLPSRSKARSDIKKEYGE